MVNAVAVAPEEEKQPVPLIMYINAYRGILRGVNDALGVVTDKERFKNKSFEDMDKMVAGIELAQKTYAKLLERDANSPAGIPADLKEWIDTYTENSGVPPLAASENERELKSHVSLEAGFAAHDIARKTSQHPELAGLSMDAIVQKVTAALTKAHGEAQEKAAREAVTARVVGGRAVGGTWQGR